MSVRVKRWPKTQSSTELSGAPEYSDSSFDQRETTVDGYSFHWGANEVRNFLDDGVGLAHAAFKTEAIVQDTVPFGDARA